MKSRRKDVLLVDGAIFVNPEDGDLVRIEGRLSKTPSFWTRRVEVVRHYQRINGVRVPVAIESIASVLIAGRSTFKMTYQYETINGQQVGSPVRGAPAPEPAEDRYRAAPLSGVRARTNATTACAWTERQPVAVFNSATVCRAARTGSSAVSAMLLITLVWL